MSANEIPNDHPFDAQTATELLNHLCVLICLRRALDQSGIAAMVNMDSADLVQLALPGAFASAHTVELSDVLTGVIEESGAPASLFGCLLGRAALAICEYRAAHTGA